MYRIKLDRKTAKIPAVVVATIAAVVMLAVVAREQLVQLVFVFQPFEFPPDLYQLVN